MKEKSAKKKKRVWLMIDFHDTAALASFVFQLKASGFLAANAAVYEADALDFQQRSGGVGRKGTYILLDETAEWRTRLVLRREEAV